MKMKKIFTIIAAMAVFTNVQAQRYKDKIFTSVSIDSVIYGTANTFSNAPQDLKMNIYQPVNDTASNRPLLVFAHGGSFVGGSRYAGDVVYLCNEFAKRGYVCVSIQYRLGVDITEILLDQSQAGPQFANAVWRGTLDGRGAIRYLRANANTYKISLGQVYLGGVSAGGVLGLHEAFLDLPSEVGAANPKFDTVTIGGIEGSSGTPGQSWRVKGVINLCGAIGDVNWMSNNKNVSIFSVHGTKDATVPYKTDYFSFNNLKIGILSGSFVVDSMAKLLGMKSVFYTFKDAPHVPFSPGVGTVESSTSYMDTTETLLRDFLFDDIKTQGVGVYNVLAPNDVKLYPNPAKEMVTIDIAFGTKNIITLMDLSGKIIETIQSNKASTDLNLNHLQTGIYFVNIYNENGSITKKLIVE
jgi:poly(3-hydroxybutyrate) depolymerase